MTYKENRVSNTADTFNQNGSFEAIFDKATIASRETAQQTIDIVRTPTYTERILRLRVCSFVEQEYQFWSEPATEAYPEAVGMINYLRDETGQFSEVLRMFGWIELEYP